MEELTINQPKKLVVAKGAIDQLITDLRGANVQQVFILADPHVADEVLRGFEKSGLTVDCVLSSGAEPSFSDFDRIILKARQHQTEFVIGIGGGSVLDLAKLVASLICADKPLSAYVGSGLIKSRDIPLACVPTTSGAGSESSPNAILIDESSNAKKAVIDAVLMPDAVYIDPQLITSLPPDITAYTGLDALTHCIEAYANKCAHPVIDMYALEGIRLISQNLGKTIQNGGNLEARAKVALGAYYGGMCLGPVNTAAVHALAYPLGTTYKIAHGLSNALLLPFVLEFNLEEEADRYADVAVAMGGKKLGSKRETAMQGIRLIRQFIEMYRMPSRLSELEVSVDSIAKMAQEALLIQRLLKNNVREVHLKDAVSIYQNAM